MIRPEKNWIEWLVFALGIVIIAATVGVLLHAAVTVEEEAPVSIELTLGDAREDHGNFLVPVEVRNHGARAAANVRIEVVLTASAGEERAAFVLDYAPGRSVRHVEVNFSHDPREGRLSGRAVGFELP
jgi:uncharacterized protein (TIGR02588 family)